MRRRGTASWAAILTTVALAACGGGTNASGTDADPGGGTDLAGPDGADAWTGDLALDTARDLAPGDAEAGPDGTASDLATDGAASDLATDDGIASDLATDLAADGGPDLPPRVCRTPTPWTPGTKAFTDVSVEAGLRGIGVNGVRLNAVDWDGDGRPDLVVRGYDTRREVFDGDAPIRNTFLLHNEGGMTFADRTQASGFLATRDGAGGRVVQGVVWGDVDNDGDLDALTVIAKDPNPATPDLPDTNEVMLNNGDGTFSLADGGAIRLEGERRQVIGLTLADVDRDGNLDAFLGVAFGAGNAPDPDRLFRGDGTGSFADITGDAGIVTADWSLGALVAAGRGNRVAYGATACDLNGDGWPDLISSAYGRYFNALWMGGPGGHFTDRSLPSGVGSDDRKDWTTNMNAQCYCKLMPDTEGCAGVPPPPNYFACTSVANLRWDESSDREDFRLGGNNFTAACGDVDNDGDLDILDTTIVHWDVGNSSDPTELLINDGAADPTFARPGPDAMGLTRNWGRLDWNAGDMTASFLDFDGDGRQDLLIGSSDYPGTRAFLFHQKTDGTFEQVSVADGIDQKHAHGVAVADFDGDGDLDVAVGHGLARCSDSPTECYPTAEVHLFRNDVGQDANFLKVILVGGPGSNRSAIGARVRVTAGGVTQTQEVGGGYGHNGIQNDLGLTFGLGAACDVDKVEVRWPDANLTTQTFTNVRANYRVRITQDHVAPEYLTAF